MVRKYVKDILLDNITVEVDNDSINLSHPNMNDNIVYYICGYLQSCRDRARER